MHGFYVRLIRHMQVIIKTEINSVAPLQNLWRICDKKDDNACNK